MLRILVFVLASATLNSVDSRSRKGEIETTTENCDYSRCIMDVTGSVCSDHGTCNCEHCECDDPYIGRYCEQMGSGSRGDCDPKKCMGEDGDICNNQGTCNCDRCECGDSFSGPKCEVAIEDLESVCKQGWNCRLCNRAARDPGGFCRYCETVEKVRVVQVRDVLDLLELKGSHCTFTDEHSCLHNYRVSSPDVNGTRVVYFPQLSMCDDVESSTEYSVERRKSHRGDSPIEPETDSSSALSDSDNDDSGAIVGYSGHLMLIPILSLLTIYCRIGTTTF
ncbi:integrin beta-like protein 1 isoform X2 [Dreissena polymorpha]|uniref:Uncharacterized protein n=1 Tax=Dreissena polymorpha TaxID=45954 RepID=A0A9D4IKG0_DREPO|nr:integrin beta-like protein 1 isoform X2 [Dreissena polymorpha]KAH3775912.1 hypothetical protein DPMN_177322 [Dreissena polymorpha]